MACSRRGCFKVLRKLPVANLCGVWCGYGAGAGAGATLFYLCFAWERKKGGKRRKMAEAGGSSSE
ncbi:hypothetical protein LY76DRAFT_680100 [Colletotrichum caudatum]|nr:hypothetical protein LY76DRAFT_680100 [Colletotrichum caudatum]